MKKTPDNHWAHHTPHMMIAVPDLEVARRPADRSDNGGPYVMWKGTPYAHIMAPVTNGKTGAR